MLFFFLLKLDFPHPYGNTHAKDNLILRYALQLLSPSKINAEIECTGPIVHRKDIEAAKSLFIDAGRSMAYLKSTNSISSSHHLN